MKLKELLEKCQDSDIAFINTKFKLLVPRTWVSNVIRVVAGSPNHSCVLLKDEEGWMVIGARTPVVKVTSPEWEFIDNKVTIKRLKNADTMKMHAVTESLAGTPYDYDSLLLWHVLYKITGIWFGKKGVKSRKRLYCYEATALVCEYPKTDTLKPVEYFKWDKFETVVDNEIITA